MRVDIPVDQYPNFNFVGRLLGPRGNSLKRVEASTNCRVLIRGRGSIKDPVKEEMMRGKSGYEHLNEPLHVIVEAELPIVIIDARLIQAREILEDLLKPVDESQDFFKKQQLRELAMLKVGTFQMPSPYIPTITNYTQLWWVLNVVVAHQKEGIEAVHLATGRTICRLHLQEGGLHADINGDRVLDHVQVDRM